MQLNNNPDKNPVINLLKYTPECSHHGYMKQVKNNRNIFTWECLDKKCNETMAGLKSINLLDAIVDSQHLDIKAINQLDYEMALVHFLQLLNVEYPVLINVLFENEIHLEDNWLINLSKIEKLVESRIRTELNEKLVQASIERSLIERAKSNFRICLICGKSNCNRINSCMDVSD